jgi:dimethylhistidine N-methyltransferase
MSPRAPRRVELHDLAPEVEDFRAAVWASLARRPRTLPCKFFYDAAGSALFDRICELPEYYPTRTELAILEACATELAELAGPGRVLVEYGSGSSTKVRVLLRALIPAAYLAIDISREHLLAATTALAGEWPGLRVLAVCADYVAPLRLPALADAGARLGFFPGSTIGNFTPLEAARFLGAVHRQLGPGGALLVGVDLKKDPERLHAAYNDAQGVTAAFNLNLLARINRELGADFDLAAFRHAAFYNAAAGRVEMHLESLARQCASVAGRRFEFAAGERIHTENSYKYTVAEFQQLATQAGFHPRRVWTDPEALFSVHYLTRG